MLYFEEPDGVTHHHGPRSVEAAAIIHRMDSLVGMLRQGIASLPFGKDVNLIVTADHGMTEISDDRVRNGVRLWMDGLRPLFSQNRNIATRYTMP